MNTYSLAYALIIFMSEVMRCSNHESNKADTYRSTTYIPAAHRNVQILDAVVSYKNVQKPLGNKQPWTLKSLLHR